MTATVISYALYLALAILLTVWVARTLHKNGRVFLVDCFRGNEELADSVNHLLVVGIFYDADCGICTRFRRWMENEPAQLRHVFLPYNSRRALELCPSLPERGADREIVVMADDGRLWQGAEAWVTCLWTLRRWRKWSKRLASAALLPVAARACKLISANRLTLSRLAGLVGEAVLAQEIEDAGRDAGAMRCAIREVDQSRGERGTP